MKTLLILTLAALSLRLTSFAQVNSGSDGHDGALNPTSNLVIYTADPFKDPKAKKYDRITYAEALAKRLSVMDSTAFSLCMDNKMPIIVFDMMTPRAIRDVVMGRKVGTLVTG